MQNSSDRTDSISSVGDYPTVRFDTGPVKGHCPKVSTGPKIRQQVSSARPTGDQLGLRPSCRTRLREVLASHGQRIFALSPYRQRVAHEREPTDLHRFLAADIYSPSSETTTAAPNTKRVNYFRCEALYELIWAAPMMEIAQQLGVSDIALGNLCRRADIPTPWRGYWPRAGAGQQLERTELPPAPAGLPELLRIRGRSRHHSDRIVNMVSARDEPASV